MFEYAPSKEDAKLARIEPRYGHFINGKFRPPVKGSYFTTKNPATGKTLSEVAVGTLEDINRAVAAARAAQPDWAALDGSVRATYLFRLARLLDERSKEFAVLESLDNGKPIKETRDFDVPTSVDHFFFHAGFADKLDLIYRGAKPLGVVGQIVPWNFPLLMLAWKVAPALACGNTVVLKPSETTPLTALRFAELATEAGLPAGVLNIVTGDGETGRLLVSNQGLDKIAFTGSTEVGKEIQRTLAGTNRRLTLELGGKGANIVFADAPLDQVVEGVISGIFFNQGQVCCAGSRLLVEESALEPLLSKLKRRIGTLRLGDPLDKNTDIGAINSSAQLARIRSLVEAGVSEGATLWQSDCALPKEGYFYPPTLLLDASPAFRVAKEEIFGPVLTVMTFQTPEEAIRKVNNTRYGLSAGVWTGNPARALWMGEKLKAGVVWLNTFNRFDPSSPFGGYKESGFGREGGIQGLAAYLEIPS